MNIPFIKQTKNRLSPYLYVAAAVLTGILFFVVGVPKTGTTSFFDDIAILGIVSLGQLFVMISGGIDFSLQGIYSASAILMSHIYMNSARASSEVPSLVIILIILAGAALIGMINGFLIARFNINPLIVTFAMNTLIIGIMYAYTNGITGRIAPPAFKEFVDITIFKIPLILIFWLVMVLVIAAVLKKTVSGRILYATGANRNSAYLAGINVKRVTVLSYTVSGVFAGLAGMLACANNGYSTLTMADNVTIQTLLVVLLSGTSVFGGTGKAYKMIFAALIITDITYIFRLIPVHAGIQNIALGVMLLTLCVFSLRKSGMIRKNGEMG